MLGLDVGSARTGVALSDELGIVATPHDTIQVTSLEADARAVKSIVEEHGVARVVVGLPLDQNGEVGPQARRVLEFIEVLRPILSVEVVTQDERFSTAAAQRGLRDAGLNAKKQRGVIDKAAAQQILHLDREAARRRRSE
jgi:putative holliday junction resolvase